MGGGGIASRPYLNWAVWKERAIRISKKNAMADVKQMSQHPNNRLTHGGHRVNCNYIASFHRTESFKIRKLSNNKLHQNSLVINQSTIKQ